MNDKLYDRLQAVDPARHGDERAPDDAWIAAVTNDIIRDDRPAPPRRRLVAPLAVAAATTLIVGGAVTATVMIGGDDKPGNSVAGQPPQASHPLRLKAPASGVSGSCIRWSVDLLAEMPVAFSGTVASVEPHAVTLDADHWYRGGDADQVQIATIDDSIALEGIPEFAVGDRYLITATDGTVNACGFSVPWSAEMADAFAQAFG